MADALVRVVDVLRHLEVSLAAAGSRVVVGVSDPLQVILADQLVHDVTAERLLQAVVLALVDALCEVDLAHLFAVFELGR